jgi:hypothetical protein
LSESSHFYQIAQSLQANYEQPIMNNCERAAGTVPNTDVAGAVGIWQVARRAGAAFGRCPAANRLIDTCGDKIEIITVGELVTPTEAHVLAEEDKFQFRW